MKRIMVLLLLSGVLFGRPHRLIVIPMESGVSASNRYAEVPLGPNGPKLIEGLDSEGQRGASALVEKLFPTEKVAWVAAYKGNQRAIQTLLPLVNAHFPKQAPTDVYVYTSPLIRQYGPKDLPQLKKDILETHDGNVIICWEKGEMDQLYFDSK